jgi:group I intron endonuclease
MVHRVTSATSLRFIIYCITCKKTGKKYVGQTKNSLNVRWSQEVCGARSRSRGPRVLFAAIRKYGPKSFVREILEVVHGTYEDSDKAERRWISKMRCRVPHGYNLDAGGKSRGDVHEETRRRIRNRFTPAQWKERSMRVAAMQTPEQHRARVLKGVASQTAEQLHLKALKAARSQTLKQLRAKSLKAWAAPGAREKASLARKAWWRRQSPERLAEIAKKIASTRRAHASRGET